MRRKKKQTAVVEPKPDLKRELWGAADNLVSALYAYDRCCPMDDTAVADTSAAELEAVKRSLVQMYREDTAVEKEKPKTLRDVLREKWLASQRFPTTSRSQR